MKEPEVLASAVALVRDNAAKRAQCHADARLSDNRADWNALNMISGHAGKGRLLDFGVLGDITEGPSKNVFYQIRSAEDLGSFVDVQICTETSKSAATIEKRHSTPDGNVSLYHLHYFLSHRLQYTLFGNMMFLFEGKWIVDCSKYSDRQPLRSFFHKQARFKCTVANAKLSFKTCEKKGLERQRVKHSKIMNVF